MELKRFGKRLFKDHERKKGETDLHRGIFLGDRWRTPETIVSTLKGLILCRTIRIDPEAEKLTEEDMDSIKDSVIEVFYSKKEDNDEPNYAEEDDGTDSPVMDESGIANISGDINDEEGDQPPGEQGGEHVGVRVIDDHLVKYSRLQRS